MKVTERDKTIIKIASCVLLVVVAWLYGFNYFNEQVTILERENELLERQIEMISKLEGSYEAQAAEFKEEAAAHLARFPVAVKEEDQILYADSLTDKVPGTRVYYVTTPPAEQVEVLVPNREDVLASMVDATGEMTMNNYQPDGSILSVGEFVLTRSVTGISLQTDYDGLKKILNDIISSQDVKSIEDIALTYDNAGGILNGAMNVNFYALSGTGKEYVAPDPGSVRHGMNNIFGEGIYSNAPVAVEEPLEGEAAEGEVTEGEGTEKGAAQAEGDGTAQEAAPAAQEAQEESGGGQGSTSRNG